MANCIRARPCQTLVGREAAIILALHSTPSWESKYTESFTAMSPDLDADGDGDGQSNLEEYIAGLDPGDASSVFKVETSTVAGASDGMMTIQWQSQPGRVYHLHFGQTPADLSSPPLFTVSGDGSLLIRQVPKNGAKAMFCRISVEVAER